MNVLSEQLHVNTRRTIHIRGSCLKKSLKKIEIALNLGPKSTRFEIKFQVR